MPSVTESIKQTVESINQLVLSYLADPDNDLNIHKLINLGVLLNWVETQAKQNNMDEGARVSGETVKNTLDRCVDLMRSSTGEEFRKQIANNRKEFERYLRQLNLVNTPSTNDGVESSQQLAQAQAATESSKSVPPITDESGSIVSVLKLLALITDLNVSNRFNDTEETKRFKIVKLLKKIENSRISYQNLDVLILLEKLMPFLQKLVSDYTVEIPSEINIQIEEIKALLTEQDESSLRLEKYSKNIDEQFSNFFSRLHIEAANAEVEFSQGDKGFEEVRAIANEYIKNTILKIKEKKQKQIKVLSENESLLIAILDNKEKELEAILEKVGPVPQDNFPVNAKVVKRAVKIRDYLVRLGIFKNLSHTKEEQLYNIFKYLLTAREHKSYFKNALSKTEKIIEENLKLNKKCIVTQIIKEAAQAPEKTTESVQHKGKGKVGAEPNKALSPLTILNNGQPPEQCQFIRKILQEEAASCYEKLLNKITSVDSVGAAANWVVGNWKCSDFTTLFLLRDQWKRIFSIRESLSNSNEGSLQLFLAEKNQKIEEKFQVFLGEEKNPEVSAKQRLAELQVDIVQKIWRKEWRVSIGGKNVSIVGEGGLKYESTVPTGVAEMVAILKRVQELENKGKTQSYEKAWQEIEQIAQKRLATNGRRHETTENFYNQCVSVDISTTENILKAINEYIADEEEQRVLANTQELPAQKKETLAREKKTLMKIVMILKEATQGKCTYKNAFDKVQEIIAFPTEPANNKNRSCFFGFFQPTSEKNVLPELIREKIGQILNRKLNINENMGDRAPAPVSSKSFTGVGVFS